MLALLLPIALFAASPVPKVGSPAPKLSVEDVKGRKLEVPDPGHVMLLSFASKSTGETAGDITRQVRVAHPELTIYSFIDFSGFPKFLRGTVKKKVLARQSGAVDEDKKAFEKAGKTPPDDLDARIHIVCDFDASSSEAYGASDTGHQAMIVVVGADGNVRAVFEKTPAAADVEAAVAKEMGTK